MIGGVETFRNLSAIENLRKEIEKIYGVLSVGIGKTK
jgi:hypothetical protein